MRDIKFRAWQRASKRMSDVKYLRWLANGKIASIGCGDETGYQERLRPRDCVLMQHTGRKDKINIPIYEDDIVELKREGAYIGRGRVIFSKGQFLIEGSQLSLAGDLSHYEGEVIGNIYETPGLLDV